MPMFNAVIMFVSFCQIVDFYFRNRLKSVQAQTTGSNLHEEAPTQSFQLKHNSVDAAAGTSADTAPAF